MTAETTTMMSAAAAFRAVGGGKDGFENDKVAKDLVPSCSYDEGDGASGKSDSKKAVEMGGCMQLVPASASGRHEFGDQDGGRLTSTTDCNDNRVDEEPLRCCRGEDESVVLSGEISQREISPPSPPAESSKDGRGSLMRSHTPEALHRPLEEEETNHQIPSNPIRKERVGGGSASGSGSGPCSSRNNSSSSRRQPSFRKSGGSMVSSGGNGRSRVLSVPTNLGRDELSLNKLRFTSLGLYGRDMEILQLREAYDEVRFRRKQANEMDGNGRKGGGRRTSKAKTIARRRRGVVHAVTGKATLPPTSGGAERSSLSSLHSCSSTQSTASSSPRMVLIGGRSGCGKSALATNVRGHVRRTGGLFASGKFDSLRRSEPYTAFARAFSGLCEDILALAATKPDGHRRNEISSSSSAFLRMRSAIRDAVGSDGAVLAEVVPHLHRLIGSSSRRLSGQMAAPGFSMGGFEGTKNRFQFAMRKFLRAVCLEMPLVLFLDDLQWADPASLELLKNLLTDWENPNLLVLGSYRDNEVAFIDHPFNKCLRELKGCDALHAESDGFVDIAHINLGNIDVDAVNELIADLLNSCLTLTRGLAEIVHRKTHGNGFALVQFLKSLHEEGILYYCLGTLGWKWDEEEVKVGTSVTDNVADLMTHKIENHLTTDMQEVLRMASCLGSTFDSAVLAAIACDVVQDKLTFSGASGRRKVVQCLDSCVDEGLLETDGSDTQYRFAHDQIAAAAFALITEKERELLQLRIGEALLANLSESDVERDLFVVVGLINRGASLLQSGVEKSVAYAILNLRAGRKAMDASAFEPAAKYLRTGINLLGPNCWHDHPTLTLDLFSTAAEAECVNAHQEEMKSYIDDILVQDLPIKDKVRAYCTRMHSLYFLQDKALEALDVGLVVLKELGVCFPRNNLKRATLTDIVKTKLLFRKLPIAEVSLLPAMEEETRLIQMQIMNKLCDLAYFARPAFLPWVVLKMVRMSVKRGVCKYSSGAFACYGLILVQLMGNFQKAHEFAKVAVALLKRFNARECDARVLFVCNCFISHWMVPAHLTHKRLFQGYEVGMQTGDTGFAMLSVRTYCQLALFIGKPLSLVDTEMSTYTQQMKDLKQEKVVMLLLPAWQLVLNLMGGSDDPTMLSGEAMQEEKMLRHCDDNGDDVLRNIIASHQIWAAFYFGNYEFGGKIVERTTGKTNRATLMTWRRALFDGLTAFELARTTKSRKWKVLAEKVAAKVRTWSEKGNVNCLHVQFLFDAEKAALEGKHSEARKKYEKAIATVSRHGFLNDRALANERAGEYFLWNGDKYFAAHHLGLAHQLYSNWGAVGKAAHLHNKHKHLFDEDSGVPIGKDISRRWSD